jgi:hypothetical protein
MTVFTDFEKYAFSKPTHFSVEVELDGDTATMRYMEEGVKPEDLSEEEFRYTAEVVKRKSCNILKSFDPEGKFTLTVNGSRYKSEMDVEGPAGYIMGGLALEFLQHSPQVRMMLGLQKFKMSVATYFIGLLMGALIMYIYLAKIF